MRFEPQPGLKRVIRERFKYECAACGRACKLTSDVAHLFEDATRHCSEPDRLIVLCSNCNQAEERAKSRSKPSLFELFSPGKVLEKARQRYRLGNYSGAYQGHRLAAYLFDKQGYHSTAVGCLVEAISDLRPIRWGDFLRATLIEIERLCCTHEVGLVQRWLCVDRFALVLYDYRLWRESGDIQSAAAQLLTRLDSDQRDPEGQEFDYANSFRREVLITACQPLFAVDKLPSILGRLEEDAREFERIYHYDSFATNLDVAGKLAVEVGQNADLGHEYSQRALEKASKITHKWVLQEHYWREAEYYRATAPDRARANVIEALRIFRDHPVVLEPTLGAAGPILHDPFRELERYGIEHCELREHGVAPSSNPPLELPLELSWKQMGEIIKNVMGT